MNVDKPLAALSDNVLQQRSRAGRTLHVEMTNSYIESAKGPVLSYNTINEADPAVGHSIDRLHDREDDSRAVDKEHAKQREEFLQWISPLDFHSTQTATFERHAVGTGTWLLQDSRFLDWLEGKIRLLWCHGDPGVGKTILTSVIIDHLQRFLATPEDVVIYIYCEYNRKVEQTSMRLLGSILKQLVERRPAISQHLLSLYKTHSSQKTMPTFPELMDALHTELQSYTRAYLIVDALDECSDEARNLFLSKESPLGLRSFADNLQLLMTSRNMPSITHALKVEGDKSTIHIEAHVEDLQTYIRGCFVGVKRLNQLVKDNRSLQNNIIEVVILKAAGMFLLAKLHLYSLARQTNVKALRKALEGLPADIWKSYDNAMLRIDAQGETDSKLAYHIFYWLSCSKRPLTVLELQHAVAVSLDSEMTDMEPDAIVDIRILTDVCAGLIITDESLTRARTTVRLVHYTMQKYLQSNQQRLFPDIQSLIAITCLTYMSFNVFSTKEWEDDSLHRLSSYNNQEEIVPHVQRLLKKPANVACASKLFEEHQYLVEDLHSEFSSHTLYRRIGGFQDFFLHALHSESSSHPLYLPTVFSLVQVLGKLLPNPGLGPADGTLLHLASLLGHVEIVMVLLTKLDPNTQDKNSRTPLSYSAECGRFEMVQLFLNLESIQPDLPDKDGCTPFIHACHRRHVKIVQLFLDRHDVNHNLPDRDGRAPFIHACHRGHVEIVQLLLDRHNVDHNLPDKNGCTPLIHACHHGHVKIVQLLLDRCNVDHNLRDYNGWTALFHAVDQKHLDIAQLLLQHSDLQPDIPDNTGKTPLIWAARKLPPSEEYSELMRLLLEREDVNPHSQDQHLRTALSYNAEGMCPNLFDDMIRYVQALRLLARDTTSDLQDKYLRTPLSYAIESHQSRIIKLLLESHAVDCYSPNLYLHTPISYDPSIINWSPRVDRLLAEFSQLKVNLTHDISVLNSDNLHALKRKHLARKSDTQPPPVSSQLLIAASLDKVRSEGAWAWGFNHPQTQDRYTNSLDTRYLEIVTPYRGGFHGSIHNPVYGTDTRGIVSTTTLSTTTDTCLLSNLPLAEGRYMISPGKQGIYYEVRILKMKRTVAVGLACRPHPPWRLVGCSRLSAAFHLNNMKKFFEAGKGKEYLPNTKLQNGDIVGVGFVHNSGTVFFTLNGSRLPDAFTGIFLPHSKHDLFAAIGIRGKASIEINFGAEKFMWSEGNEWAWSVEGLFDVLDNSEEGTGQSDEL
ncbi:hypothetical protein C8J56DRAFT_1172812 [Mycena floridula]|nr:hypothetical protein C8J56DRAFT_1172812 [Mycena floridula]